MTISTSVSAHLRELADPIWRAQFEHPFVRGLGDGTLDVDRFGHWLRQDYVYLVDYSRVFAYTIARSPDMETMRVFSKLLYETLEGEMKLHRSYVAEFGITVDDLLATKKAPTCQGYTDFLLRVAATGDFPEVIAALLPCMWGYSDLGIHLYNQGLPAEERYARWITNYASPEFAELAGWTRDLLDKYAANAPDSLMRRIEDAFITSSRYELAFWEMSWASETWLDERGR